jgi:hypothetical protein
MSTFRNLALIAAAAGAMAWTTAIHAQGYGGGGYGGGQGGYNDGRGGYDDGRGRSYGGDRDRDGRGWGGGPGGPGRGYGPGGQRWWRGQWWAQGTGPCWRWSARRQNWKWVCD